MQVIPIDRNKRQVQQFRLLTYLESSNNAPSEEKNSLKNHFQLLAAPIPNLFKFQAVHGISLYSKYDKGGNKKRLNYANEDESIIQELRPHYLLHQPDSWLNTHHDEAQGILYI